MPDSKRKTRKKPDVLKQNIQVIVKRAGSGPWLALTVSQIGSRDPLIDVLILQDYASLFCDVLTAVIKSKNFDHSFMVPYKLP